MSKFPLEKILFVFTLSESHVVPLRTLYGSVSSGEVTVSKMRHVRPSEHVTSLWLTS